MFEIAAQYVKASECDEAERRAIDELKKPARGEMPTFDDWFNGRFWTEWVLGGPQLYADVARAHGRSVPQTILAAGAKEADPNRRVLAQLSARLALPPKKSGSG